MGGAKNIALGVGGGIAAYKAAELARALMERGFPNLLRFWPERSRRS